MPLGTAAALIVIAVLGLQIEHMNHRIGQLDAIAANQGLSQAVQAALLDPQARRVELTSSTTGSNGGAGGNSAACGARYPAFGIRLSDQPRDAAVCPRARPTSSGDRSDGHMISIGLLGNRPTDVAMTIGQPAVFGDYAVTVEHAGGSVEPDTSAGGAERHLST